MPIDDFGSRSVSLHGQLRRRPVAVLRAMLERVRPDDAPEDLVPRFERRMAELLGKPAAALFPTGTMAQQVTMRIHAEQRGIRTVAFHPQCHLEVWEHKGYAVVHGLASRLVGDRHQLIQIADLEALAEPIAALLLELPQRDIGGQLPAWDELVAQAAWARARGAAVHLDGARLWEAQPFYDRPHGEIAALFDTVYVSLWKSLMGTSGAVLAGDAGFIEHARMWRNRLGGNMVRGWPIALAAERGLDEVLPRMPEFFAAARRIAGLLKAVPGVHVVPDPPQTPLFHVHIDAGPAAVQAVAAELLAESGIQTMLRVRTAPSPQRSSFEITVGEQFDDFTDDEVVEHIAILASRAAQWHRG